MLTPPLFVPMRRRRELDDEEGVKKRGWPAQAPAWGFSAKLHIWGLERDVTRL